MQTKDTETNNIELTPQVCARVRETVINNGTHYTVPLHKYGYYENGQPEKRPVTEAQVGYMAQFVTRDEHGQPTIGVDLEQIVPYVCDAKEIGLEREQVETLEEGLVQLATIPQTLLRSDSFRDLVVNNLAEKDKALLETERYDPSVEYLLPGTLMRADLLLSHTGKLFS